jgi:hypothetical protein
MTKTTHGSKNFQIISALYKTRKPTFLVELGNGHDDEPINPIFRTFRQGMTNFMVSFVQEGEI